MSQSRKKKEEEEGEDTKKEKQVELKPFVTNHACQPTEQLQLPCMHASMLWPGGHIENRAYKM